MTQDCGAHVSMFQCSIEKAADSGLGKLTSHKLSNCVMTEEGRTWTLAPFETSKGRREKGEGRRKTEPPVSCNPLPLFHLSTDAASVRLGPSRSVSISEYNNTVAHSKYTVSIHPHNSFTGYLGSGYSHR